MTPLELVLASNNPHKKTELLARLAHLPVRLLHLPDAPDPDETEDSFRGNARLKAEAFVALSGRPALADDSGLAVDALDGEPGVYSARYAARARSPFASRGLDTALANNLLLLDELADCTDRRAHFHCELVLAAPLGSPLADALEALPRSDLPPHVERLDPDQRWRFPALACHGIAHGRILEGPAELDADGRLVAARGTAGFGYDPLFLSDDLGITFAEATPEAKNRVSHRARALDALLAALERIYAPR